jgi:hypothetical protein
MNNRTKKFLEEINETNNSLAKGKKKLKFKILVIKNMEY